MRTGDSTHSYIALAALAIVLSLAGATAVAQQPFGGMGAPVPVDQVGDTLGVNTLSNDGCPAESSDGHMLFIASNRPSGGPNDIWVAFRAGLNGPWGDPARLPPPVNSSTANDFCPTPLSGHQLLFLSNRANNCGGTVANPDIYYTRWHPHGWLEPEPLDCSVNSPNQEFSPSLVHTHSRTILFFSTDRDNPQPAGGPHKIYMSELRRDGTRNTAEPVHELNWPGASDARPNVRRDGLEIVFDSTRNGGPPDVWTATREHISDLWSAPTPVTIVNSNGGETRPSLSHDGRRLYFGRSQSDNPGAFDVYVSTRRIGIE